jgi:hypothetical protein
MPIVTALKEYWIITVILKQMKLSTPPIDFKGSIMIWLNVYKFTLLFDTKFCGIPIRSFAYSLLFTIYRLGIWIKSFHIFCNITAWVPHIGHSLKLIWHMGT